jgi:dimethylamine/trimethylamine dehydrogenase
MSRDPRYDILFEPVKIGPVTAKNRFYQVPHCNGMGSTYPSSMAEMRAMKAEGGWGVICTEEIEIHPSSEFTPVIEGRLWDDADIPVFARMCDKIHECGALAGAELGHNGHHTANLYSREVPLSPSGRPVVGLDPVYARAMDKQDIRDMRRWHVDAALRAKRAGFDVIYVYAAHDHTILSHFLSRRINRRCDEYGGSLENRVRLFREVLEETKEAVGDSCAIAVRFAVDELMGADGISCEAEGRDVVEMLADLPDLWDVNVSGWENDSVPSRFGKEGAQEPFVSFVKQVTGKPVVGVGRFTSPDTMASMVRRGVLDLIGAARPSIADPFLPKKIEEGRIEDIRECIGCNICVSGDFTGVPMRCTQNPTVGEEWRKGWHPERIAPARNDDSVLIVGAGPAGLEAARALGQRGYQVTLTEADSEAGGRVSRESRLPGLTEWARVRDWRKYQIDQMANVALYRGSKLTAADIMEFGAAHVALATGARWRHDGLGRQNWQPVPGLDAANVLTPDDIMAGAAARGPVVIFDDDHYYMGGLMAEKLRRDGLDVTLVTPAADASHWTHNTLEQERIQKLLLELGVRIVPLHNLAKAAAGMVEISCIYTSRRQALDCATLLMVTQRDPQDALWQTLDADREACKQAGIRTLARIGDCLAPGTIAAAVYSGHRYARELDDPAPRPVPFRRELPQLAED